MHLKPQAITEGIATAAAAVVLSLLSLHFPLMIFFYLLSALPIAVLAVRQRLAAAVTASLGAMLVFLIVFLASSEPLAAIRSFFIGPFTSLRRIGNIIEGARR